MHKKKNNMFATHHEQDDQGELLLQAEKSKNGLHWIRNTF